MLSPFHQVPACVLSSDEKYWIITRLDRFSSLFLFLNLIMILREVGLTFPDTWGEEMSL